MSKELVIGSNRHETKVAVLEDDQLVEVTFQRANEYSLAGSIHNGRVTRVLPGMQSAFVDLGLERDTFLYVTDFFEENEDLDTVVDDKPARDDERLEARRDERDSDSRRERGPDNRRPDGRRERGGSGRPSGERQNVERPPTVERPPVERPVVEPERFIPAPEPRGADDLPAFGVAGVTERPVDGEVRSPEGIARTADGRNRGGGNDQRGRRSRRRRGRGGRAIPDNKYAQPTAAGEPVAGSAPVEPTDIEEEAEEPEVMLLPGESLAKYRGKPAVASAPAQLVSKHEKADEEDADGGVVEPAPVRAMHLVETPDAATQIDAADSQAEIAEEAHELELAEKVFGHREADPPIVEESVLHEVEHDHAAHEVHQEQLEDISWSSERKAADERLSNVVPIDEGASAAVLHDPEAHEHLSFISGSAHATEFEPEEEDDLDESEADAGLPSVGHLSPEVEDALARAAGEGFDTLEEKAIDPESRAVDGGKEPTGEQSASLRDQGGRYPHRSSRRMRRRRGGSRFGDSNAPASAAAPNPVAGALAAGASPAIEPESRLDNRAPRESRDSRGDREDEVYEARSSERPDRVMPSISDLLKAGQEIIVQIAKEPLGQKGARITSHIALPGRYVVFMPSVNHLGVSRKVSSEEERLRLKKILQTHREGTTGGFIVRTAGEGVPEEEIAADMSFLYTLWLDIRQKAEKKPAPLLLHYDLDVVQRILRDQVTDEFKAIWVDNEELYENVVTFMQRFQPALVNRVKMYTRSAPIFDAFNITQELEKALRPKVWLKSGGYIVINQTEALVAIDINTGKYVGKSNRLEDTIVKTNTEAVKEIVRQIRLRDLGGIIVVDFIDMDERKNRQKVMQALEEAMRADKAPYKILQFNDFGLVAITRKRVKQSLERTLCSPCPYCEGAGYVKSVQTIISEILVEAQKLAKAIEGKDVLLRVHPEVAKVLKASDNKYLEELEEILKRPVMVKGDPSLHHEKFDLG